MNLTDIYAGITDRLATMTTARHYDHEPVSPTTPSVFAVLPLRGSYDVDFDDGGEVDVRVRLLVATADQRAATVQMLRYLASTGAYSIKAAIEADRTLSGACDSATVTSWELASVRYGTNDYLSVDFIVNVLA